MDNLLWVIGIVVGLIVVMVILAAAARGMRPKVPEAQTFTPAPAFRSTSTNTTNTTPAGISPQAIAEIDRLVAADQKIMAIKALRQHTGIGLKDAKDRIEHWSISTTAAPSAALSHSAAAYSSIPMRSGSIRSALPASVVAEIDRLVAADQKISAIKLVREHTGFGLKDAKDAIDAWR